MVGGAAYHEREGFFYGGFAPVPPVCIGACSWGLWLVSSEGLRGVGVPLPRLRRPPRWGLRLGFRLGTARRLGATEAGALELTMADRESRGATPGGAPALLA